MKAREVAELLNLKKNTLLYHVRTKEKFNRLFKIDVKDCGYYIDNNDIESLLKLLLEDKVISEDVFNRSLKYFSGNLSDSTKKDTYILEKDIEISMLELENKHLKELISTIQEENRAVKEELKEKNVQINKLIDENHINQQLMIQYQLERNKLIESVQDDSKDNQEQQVEEDNNQKVSWWKRLFSR